MMKRRRTVQLFICSLFIVLYSCQHEQVINNASGSSNKLVNESNKDTVVTMTKSVFLDTSMVLKLVLQQVLKDYKPKFDVQYDLDKANWGGDDRLLLRNYFTDKELFPSKTPDVPIVIREIVWQVDKDNFITYWFKKMGDSWSYICNSDIYPMGTEF